MQYNQNYVDNQSVFSKQCSVALPEFCAIDLTVLFNQCFANKTSTDVSSKTYLISHASEPIYLPHTEDPSDFFDAHDNTDDGSASAKLRLLNAQPLSSLPAGNKIFFTRDYFASALHEIAHWCIAGKLRRSKVDYGYWYAPDGRNLQQQLKFETVEVKPQAIEWAFSLACNKPFLLSNDNLSLLEHDSARFEGAVKQQLFDYIERGFPERAQMFLSRLRQHYDTEPFQSLPQSTSEVFT